MPGVNRAFTVVCVLALCWGVPRTVSAQSQVADTGWSTLRVPGGTSGLLRAAGLDPSTPRAQALWTLVRSLYSYADRIDPNADQRRQRVFSYLETLVEYERLTLPDEFVPSPLPEGTWNALLPPPSKRAGTLVARILMDRQASLLFVGLSTTDGGTRSYLASNPALVDTIYRTPRVAELAAHGRSLRVRDGRVEVPGGPDAVPLWESVVGEAVARPDRFLLELLGKDSGQAAGLYDVVANLDEGGRAFVLGPSQSDPAGSKPTPLAGTLQAYVLAQMPSGSQRRVDQFRALYAASLAAGIGSNPVSRPFNHGVYDAAHLLALMRFTADGRPLAPAWRKLWDAALADVQAPPAKRAYEWMDFSQGGTLSAADIVERICVANVTVRRERAEMWLFAQRVFAKAPVTSMPDVLVALQGYQRFGALVLTLERLGITEPAVYATAVVRAQRVSDASGAAAGNALALFQGSLAMIERARLGAAIDAATASRLVASLADVPMTYDGEALGSVADWVALTLLPALKTPRVVPTASGDAAPIEHHVLGAFAGLFPVRGPQAAPVVEIEGLRYRVDPAAADAARWQAVRAVQGGVTLDQVLAFADAIEGLVINVQSVSALPERMSALVASAAPLVAHEPSGQTAAGPPPHLRRLLDDAASRVAGITTSDQLTRLLAISYPLLRAVDFFLAEVMIELAYAPHLGDPSGKAMLGGDPSQRHDWGLTELLEKSRLRAPWRIPSGARDAAGVWRISGSLLALDVGFGDLALRRVFTESLPDPPTITGNDRAAFTEGVSLANAFDYLDADRDTLVEAIRRGRNRVTSARSTPGVVADLISEAGIRDARREMIPWTLVHEPDRLPDFFSLGEMLRIGQMQPSSIARLDAWGTSGLAREGCLCLRFPLTGDSMTVAGRLSKAVVASLMPDLALLVAESLRERQLPAMLTRSILAAATQDFEDEIRLAFDDDWISMFRQVPKTLSPRMDDYIASLTTNGPLVPIR